MTRGIQVPIAVEGLAWVRPRRLIVQLQGNAVWVVDPTTGAILARTHAGFSCSFTGAARESADGLVIIGRRRVVAVNSDGRRRVARSGSRPGECDGAGVAVAGGSAWVMARSSRLTEVRLASMRIRDHRLRGPRPAGGA